MRSYISSKQNFTLEVLKIMAEFTVLCISWTVIDDSGNEEEDTNGGHVHLPEMTVEITIVHVGIS